MYLQPEHEYFKHLPALQGVLYRDYILHLHELSPNQALTPKHLQAVMNFAERPVLAEPYVLRQRGNRLMELCSEQAHLAGEQGFKAGFRLLTFPFRPETVIQCPPNAGSLSSQVEALRLTDDGIELRLPDSPRQQLHIGGEAITLERFAKPEWAVAVSCVQDCLTVTTQSAEKTFDWYWHPPEIDRESAEAEQNAETDGMWPGFWYDRPGCELKPNWADAVGRDRYGLYADVSIAGVVQRFRWIQSGSFWMGSPEQEEGRHNNELLHKVTLSQGYWLADTACTQALWQAVTGKNPSRFEGERRPVENISWEGVQAFLERVNRSQQGLNLRLPTEAEWEYACRAGTCTPFSFDGKPDLDKLNFRETWDDSDNWGKGALKQTAEVKRYPANAWGLYEMHGNVWECCIDWLGRYLAEPVTDPKGPDAGDYRIIRGGSWIGLGRSCRSAYRIGYRPFLTDDILGFRLARSHESVQPSSGADRQPDERRAVAARGAQPGDGRPDGAIP